MVAQPILIIILGLQAAMHMFNNSDKQHTVRLHSLCYSSS